MREKSEPAQLQARRQRFMVHIQLKAIVPITLNANVRLVEGSTYGRFGQWGGREVSVEEEEDVRISHFQILGGATFYR
jgi:hypothetical protein